MGAGELASVTMDGNQFHASLSFDMDGHAIDPDKSGLGNQQIDGTISLQNSQTLPFTGNRTE
jgi:hypothetical protein